MQQEDPKRKFKLINDLEMRALDEALPDEMMIAVNRLSKYLSQPLNKDQIEAVTSDIESYLKRNKFYHAKLLEHIGRLKQFGQYSKLLEMGDQRLDQMEQKEAEPFRIFFPLPKGAELTEPVQTTNSLETQEPPQTIETVDHVPDESVSVESPETMSKVLDEPPILEQSGQLSQLIQKVVEDSELITIDNTSLDDVSSELDQTIVEEPVEPPEEISPEADIDVLEPDVEMSSTDESGVLVEASKEPSSEKSTPDVQVDRYQSRQDRIQDYINKDQSQGSTISYREDDDD